MANFSTSDFGDAQASPFTPRQAIANTAPAAALEVAGAALNTVFDIAEGKRKQAGNAMMNEFTQETLRIAQAVEQGGLKATDARTHMRALFSKYSASAPGMTDEFLDRQRKLLSQEGLGKVIADGTAAEQAGIALQKEAIGAGWASADMPMGEIERRTTLYADMKRSEAELVSISKRMAAEKSGIELESSKIGLQNSIYEQQSQKALASMAGAVTPKFRMDMDNLIEQVNTGRLTAEDAVRMAEGQWATVQANISSVGVGAGSDHLRALSSPMETMYNNTIAHLKGDVSLDILKNQNDKAIALSSKSFLSNPRRAAFVAANRLLPNAPVLQVYSQLNDEMVTFMEGMSKEDKPKSSVVTSDPEEIQSVNGWMAMLESNMDMAAKNNLSDEAVNELSTNLVNMFKSVDIHGTAASEPKEFQRVMDFIASPKFGKYTTATGGVPAEITMPARQMLEQQYDQKVIPLLKQEWEQAIVRADTGSRQLGGVTGSFGTPRPSGSGNTNAASLIKPQWSGSGIVFSGTSTNSAQDRSIRLIAADLNKRVAPTLNKMIRASAHMEGNTDYKRVYEENYVGIFGEAPAGQEVRTQQGQATAPRVATKGMVVDGYELVDPSNPRSADSWRRVNE